MAFDLLFKSPMIKVYAGDDTYTSYNQALNEAKNLAQELGRNLVILEADDLSTPKELAQHLESISLFNVAEVVLAKRLLKSAALSKYVQDSLDKLNNSYLVIWHDGKVDKRQALVKKLISDKLLTEYDLPKGSEFVNWIVAKAKEKNIKLSSSLATQILMQIGDDPGRIEQELQKLALFLAASNSEVSEKVISQVVGAEVSGDIWKFLDSLSAGSKQVVVAELDKLMQYDDNGQYLLTMLARELQIISSVKFALDHHKSTADLGLHRFVVEKATSKARKLSWAKLQKLSKALFRLDLAIKQGKMEEKMGLLLLVLSWA
jgi:DNA polymerase-3 subunit delta